MQVNFCGKLSTDSSPAVRLEFIDTIGAWLLELNERWDHQGRLLPYLLTALIDASEAVQQAALQRLDAIGALYEADHDKDLKDILAYLPSEAHGIGWRDTGAVWAQQRSARHPILPAQFTARPRLGTRRVVAANFGHISHAICLELVSWQDAHREKAAQLLAVYLVHIEDWCQQYLHELAPALCRSLALQQQRPRQERGVADAARDPGALIQLSAQARCCAVMGLLASSAAFLGVVLPRIEDDSAELPLQLAALAAAACNIHASAYTGSTDVDLAAVLSALQASGLASNGQWACRSAVLGVLRACAACVRSDTPDDTLVQLIAMLMMLGQSSDTAEAQPVDGTHSMAKRAVQQAVMQHVHSAVNVDDSSSAACCSSASHGAMRDWLQGHEGRLNEALAMLGQDAAQLSEWCIA